MRMPKKAKCYNLDDEVDLCMAVHWDPECTKISKDSLVILSQETPVKVSLSPDKWHSNKNMEVKNVHPQTEVRKFSVIKID